MSRFLVTCQWSDDLGLLIRSMPVALELRRRGHEVAFCSPLPAPSKLIEAAGLPNLMPDFSRFPDDVFMPPNTPRIWDTDHYACLTGFQDEALVRAGVETHVELFRQHRPDVVVDALNMSACMAARVAQKPLVTLVQADMHPASPGFIWWEEKPDDLPTAVPVINAVLESYGLEAISTAGELLVGDVTLCIGTRETDPLPPGTDVTYMGCLFSPQFTGDLPDWLDAFVGDKPLIWVYSGSPRYPRSPWADSIVVLKAAVEGLAGLDARIVVTAGYQAWPDELPPLPANWRHEPFLPGIPLARRSVLMIHHGGHGSCLVGALTGTPALVVPTFSERESNARHLAALGAAEVLLPTESPAGEKELPGARLREKVDLMLSDTSFADKARDLSRRMGKLDRLQESVDAIEKLA